MVEKLMMEKWGEGVQLPEREERQERAESGGEHALQVAGWDARKEGFCLEKKRGEKGVKVGEGKGQGNGRREKTGRVPRRQAKA